MISVTLFLVLPCDGGVFKRSVSLIPSRSNGLSAVLGTDFSSY